MSNYKSCGNCFSMVSMECPLPYFYNIEKLKNCGEWKPIPCPHCGGILSEIRVHKGVKYRHCYSCHAEFPIEGD